MGFKVFTDGSVLTASDVNDYLMEQAVISCTSGARPASPNEGMTIHETDTDRRLYYSGAAWIILTEPIQTWTPTITQSAGISGTVNRGWYRRENGLWTARLKFTASSGGSAGNAIVITSPLTMANAADIGGSWSFDDATGNSRAGSLYANGTTSFLLRVDDTAAGSYLGASVTIANGDVLWIEANGTY